MKLKKMPYLLLIIVTICLITSCNKKCKHQSTYWEIDKQATCTENGSKHKECTVCHEKLDTEVIESLGHDLVHHEKEDPTCTEKGHKAYETCTRCNYTTYEKLPATGHTESEWIIDKQATCMKIGIKHKECTVCHEKLDTEVIESLGHDLVHHEKENPTCTDIGHKAYDTCTRCSYTTYEELPATGHTESNWIIDKQATCTENGSKHKECTICHIVLEVETTIGHDLVHHEKKDPTCTETGYKEYYTCTKCSYTTYEEIPELGHIYEDGICTRCGYELTSSDLLYELTSDNTGYIVTGLDYSKYDINALTIIIPSEYNGLPVVEIKEEAFKNCNFIKHIVMTNSIELVGDYAFENCNNLLTIVLSKKVVSIGYDAFSNCNKLISVFYEGTIEDWLNVNLYSSSSNPMKYALKFYILDKNEIYHTFNEITIPNNVSTIGNYQFYGFKQLEIINMSDNVKNFGVYSFSKCTNLINITIPNKVENIGAYAFEDCYNMVRIFLPSSLTSISYNAFFNCNKLYSVFYDGSIEDWLNIKFYTSSSNPMKYANDFYMRNDSGYGYYKMIELNIPESIVSIGEYQFYGFKNLEKVVIHNNVVSVGDYAFYSCEKLKEITIPNSVNYIGYSSFANCNTLRKIVLPFAGNGNTETHFGYIFGAISFEYNADFVPYSLSYVEITSSQIIDDNGFYECKNLVSVTLPNNLTSIGNEAFYNCKQIKNIVIPEGTINIGSYAFYKCEKFSELVVPTTVTSIGIGAFYGCCELTFMSLPFVGDGQNNNYFGYIFGSNTNAINYKYVPEKLTKIEITNTKQLGKYAFSGCKNLKSIKLPYDMIIIEDGAFLGCTNLTDIKIPNTTTIIGAYAFSNCEELSDIEIPNTIDTISSYAFFGCIKLINIKLPNSIKNIESYAFSDCISLSKVELPVSVTSIGNFAFQYCVNLTDINIPDGVKSIGEYAFSCCRNLVEISIPKNVERINKGTFLGSTKLKTLIIPSTVRHIENSAFEGCIGLISIEIPNSVTSIGSSAFNGCTSLTSIVIPASVTSIGWNTFSGCANLTIYCEAPKEPSGWSRSWNSSNCNVVWGYKKD